MRVNVNPGPEIGEYGILHWQPAYGFAYHSAVCEATSAGLSLIAARSVETPGPVLNKFFLAFHIVAKLMAA